jgi:hypothetical protein
MRTCCAVAGAAPSAVQSITGSQNSSESRRRLFTEGIAQPINRSRVKAIEGDHVETAGLVGFIHEVITRGGKNPMTLFCINACGGTAEGIARAVAHFGEHQGRTVAQDQVDLAGLAAEIALDQAQALFCSQAAARSSAALPESGFTASGRND